MTYSRLIQYITGLLLLVTSAVSVVQAAEKDELALVQRQLEQVQSALERARVAARQDAPANEGGRFFFDYQQVASDLDTIRSGIDRYLQPSRAQPRISHISGNYRQERP